MATPTTESWFLEGTLLPYVHYAPLDDPADASKLLQWLRAHDRQVMQMVANANAFAKRARVGGRRCARASSLPLDCVIQPQSARLLLSYAAAAWRQVKRIVDACADGDSRPCNRPPPPALGLAAHAAVPASPFTL